MVTIDHECYVDLEVAKLLKKAGFDWKCKYAYIITPDGDMPTGEEGILTDSKIDANWLAQSPTLDGAQKWLREVKNCSITIDVFVHDLDKNNIYYTYNWIMYLDGERYSGSNWDDTRYYEVAQEAAIKKALEMILEKGE